MPDDRRRDIATASTGAGLLATGGALRHAGVRHGFPGRKPKVHALSMVKAPHGKRLFWGGSTLGLLGLPPLAAGTTRAIRGNVDKSLGRVGRPSSASSRAPSLLDLRPVGAEWSPRRPLEVCKDDQKPNFWREGIRGSREALRQKADNVRQPIPAKVRGLQLGVGAGTGALGSLAARAALGRRGNAVKPFVTPIAGGLAATASVPLTNKIVRRHYPDYEVTPYGVRRKKKTPVRPSTKSSNYRAQPRSFRQDVGKAVSDGTKRYQGARTPYLKQRAVITAAGHPPVIGPFTSAAAAGRYAPPGQQRKQAVRQWAMGSGAGFPIGAAGAYGGAHLAAHSKTAEGIANDALRAKHAVHNAARRAVGMKPTDTERKSKLVARFVGTKAGKPFRTKAGAVGGAAGFIGAKMASGGVLGQTAITLNQRDQRAYNKVHHIEKSIATPQTKRERTELARKKRRSAALQTVGGSAGLGSLGLLATGKKQPAILLGTVGSGIGGVNALLGSQVQRQEAKAVDPVKKGFKDKPRLYEVKSFLPKTHLGLPQHKNWNKRLKHGKPGFLFYGDDLYAETDTQASREGYFGKADSLQIRGNDREHHDYIRRYGDRGPLPKGLAREERMKAYEARYVHHGGDKQNTWRHRTKIAEGVKNAGLGVATVGTAGWLASRHGPGLRMVARHPKLRYHAESLAGAGAVAGGAGEIAAGIGHRRQSSYANSPGGVAASALRRMRANDPEEQG